MGNLGITIVDFDLFDFSQGGQMMNPFLTHSIGFAPLLNSNMASISYLIAPKNSQSIMIPTPINPNNTMDYVPFGTTSNNSYSMSHSSCLTSISTDSIIVSDSLAFNNSELVHATHSLAEALPSLALVQNNANNQTFRMDAHRPDSQVKGKGLACASGVKRPSFQNFQASVRGFVRSMLKCARAGETDSAAPSFVVEPE
uniref:Uncharacterized protein n=1 Tax=Cannabis sativa TaxID=3483 RepID=A0A803Q2E4_CANSA